MSKAAQVIEQCINDTSFSPLRTAYALSRMHRYLQQQLFNMCYHFMVILAHNYDEGAYDDRNESACKKASRIIKIENLHEGCDIYELYKDQYTRE